MLRVRTKRLSRVENEKSFLMLGSRASTAMAVMLAAVFVYWLWFGLTLRHDR